VLGLPVATFELFLQEMPPGGTSDRFVTEGARVAVLDRCPQGPALDAAPGECLILAVQSGGTAALSSLRISSSGSDIFRSSAFTA
jgi:hypothetical protein